jgi:hypothetical protein
MNTYIRGNKPIQQLNRRKAMGGIEGDTNLLESQLSSGAQVAVQQIGVSFYAAITFCLSSAGQLVFTAGISKYQVFLYQLQCPWANWPLARKFLLMVNATA